MIYLQDIVQSQFERLKLRNTYKRFHGGMIYERRGKHYLVYENVHPEVQKITYHVFRHMNYKDVKEE